MKAEPLKKELFEKVKKLNATKIILNFQGGGDDGHLNVELGGVSYGEAEDIHKEIEEWAWEAYDFIGAGEGVDFGENVTYDLAKNEVKTQEWRHVVDYGDENFSVLEVN